MPPKKKFHATQDCEEYLQDDDASVLSNTLTVPESHNTSFDICISAPESANSSDDTDASDSRGHEVQDQIADNVQRVISELEDRTLGSQLRDLDTTSEDDGNSENISSAVLDNTLSSVCEEVNVDTCLKLLEGDPSNQSAASLPYLYEEASCSSRGLVECDGQGGIQQDLNVTEIVDNHLQNLPAWLIDHEDPSTLCDMTVSSSLEEDEHLNMSATNVNLKNFNLEMTADDSVDDATLQGMGKDASLADAGEALLEGIFISGLAQAPCSTPLKQTQPASSVSLFSLTKDLFECNEPTTECSESEEDIEVDSEEFSFEECGFDIQISESILDGLIACDESTDLNQTIPPDNKSDQIFSKAHIFNSLKIHEHSQMSVNEGILQIMNLYLKNRQSKKGLQRSVNTICSFLPEDHNMPTTAHDILTYVESLAPPVPATAHLYCENCLYYHDSDSVGHCEICGPEAKLFSRFFCYDVASLIRFFFESRDLASIMDLDANSESESTSVSCIKDGSVYKSINANRGRFDVTIIFGSDGVRIRKGSTKELWLSMFTIAEVPLHLQRSFMTVVGIWYDIKKPNMKTFLKPFVEQMAFLDQDCQSGVEWTHPVSQELNRSRVKLVVNVLDSPARAILC